MTTTLTGRALDVEVAKRVMGWRPLGPRWSEQNHSGYEWEDQNGVKGTTPAFSTDIADAWLVVRHMKEHAPTRFKNLTLVAYAYNRTYASFDAEDIRTGDGPLMKEANGEHATPHAICLAALAALRAAAAEA